MTRVEKYIALATCSMQLRQAALTQPARCRPCPRVAMQALLDRLKEKP